MQDEGNDPFHDRGRVLSLEDASLWASLRLLKNPWIPLSARDSLDLLLNRQGRRHILSSVECSYCICPYHRLPREHIVFFGACNELVVISTQISEIRVIQHLLTASN